MFWIILYLKTSAVIFKSIVIFWNGRRVEENVPNRGKSVKHEGRGGAPEKNQYPSCRLGIKTRNTKLNGSSSVLLLPVFVTTMHLCTAGISEIEQLVQYRNGTASKLWWYNPSNSFQNSPSPSLQAITYDQQQLVQHRSEHFELLVVIQTESPSAYYSKKPAIIKGWEPNFKKENKNRKQKDSQ